MKRLLACVLFVLVSAPVVAQDHPSRVDVVAQAKADLLASGQDLSGSCGAFAIVRLAAWRMRSEGAGLLDKPSGNNCAGYSVDIIAYADGQIYDVLIASGEQNTPSWQYAGSGMGSRYHAAIEPPGQPPAPTPVPTPAPVPAPIPSIDLSGVYAQFAILNQKLDELARASGDAHAAIEQNVTDGRKENQTFFETVKAQWKAIVGKAAVYAGPIIAAIFAGRATK